MSKTLEEILIENDITLQPSGARWVAKCPFHEGDRSPSFTVYPGGTYFCFGCRAWGDAVKFLVDYKKMPPDEALDYVGIDYKTPKRKEVIKIKDTSKVWPFLYECAKKYHEALLENQGALEYLKSRGLSLDTVNRYMLGYTDGSTLNLEQIFDVSMAIEYGLMTPGGYESLNHRITIPNIPKEGLCDYIIGRTVTNDKIRYLGIKTPKPIFGLADAWASPILFIVEGQFDWLLLREWGYPSVVSGGTHVTNTNINILKQKNVVIVPDNDVPGLDAAVAMKMRLGSNSIILDYQDLGVKDVSEASSLAEGRQEFARLVKEQLPWNTFSYSPTLMKSFPALEGIPHLDWT